MPCKYKKYSLVGKHSTDINSNGVYEVTTGSDGVAIHTLIKAVTERSVNGADLTPKMSRRSNTKRVLQGGDHPGCSNTGTFNHDDADLAVRALRNQCNGGEVGGNRDFYSVQGNVVAYVCNVSCLHEMVSVQLLTLF